MNVILNISIRNLLRQKRRTFFLGLGISVGMALLVLANSFIGGMSDTIFNYMIAYRFGHIQMDMQTRGGPVVFREKERIFNLIDENIDEEYEVTEQIEVYGMAVGNGKSDFVPLVANPSEGEFGEGFLTEFIDLVEGNVGDFTNDDIENPVIMAKSKADYLNLKLNDSFKMRMYTIFGQSQSARFTVAGIRKNDNSFMDMPVYIEDKKLKKILGYRSYENPSIRVVFFENPKKSREYADMIYQDLKPGPAYIGGNLNFEGQNRDVLISGYYRDETNRVNLLSQIKWVAGDQEEAFSKKGLLISSELAESMGIETGDILTNRYPARYEDRTVLNRYKVTGIYQSGVFDSRTVLMNEALFYDTYYEYLPDVSQTSISLPSEDHPVSSSLTKEWILLPRPQSTDDLKKLSKTVRNSETSAAFMKIATMYESASEFLMIETGLNAMAIVAVFILFVIIFVGVINSLRMTIRERTTEIGTIRAIGMQQKDVKNAFVLEIFFLTLFSSLIGIFFTQVLIFFLKIPAIETESMFSMLLVDKHLNFKTNWLLVVVFNAVICLIAFFSAYFPAKRASKLSVAEALRHVE